MAEDTWEEIVQRYLTTSRAVFVNPQFQIQDDKRWEMCPDFLAIDFSARQIWFVEVTTAPEPDKIMGKGRVFQSEIVPRLKTQLAKLGIVTGASNWTFGLWAFVRRNAVRKLNEKVGPLVALLKVTALEDASFSWEYWDKRRAEEKSDMAPRGASAS